MGGGLNRGRLISILTQRGGAYQRGGLNRDGGLIELLRYCTFYSETDNLKRILLKAALQR